MKSKTTPRFWARFNQLPHHIQRQGYLAYDQFKKDPYISALHFKRLKASSLYSVRINDDYRALGVRDGNTITWLWIGTHAEYEKLISK